MRVRGLPRYRNFSGYLLYIDQFIFYRILSSVCLNDLFNLYNLEKLDLYINYISYDQNC